MPARAAITEWRRIAVMSDVHANARGFAAALALARSRGFDRLLILGDLLTYGAEPREVLDLAAEAVARHDAILVKGNHDELYAGSAEDRREYYQSLPEWLRESVDWTRERIGGRDLYAELPWFEAVESDDILFAHANPFAFGDWRYLNKPTDLAAAAAALEAQGKRAGVFGHTHRAKRAIFAKGEPPAIITPDREQFFQPAGLPVEAVSILDPGSVGQPRDKFKKSTMLFLENRSSGRLIAEFAIVDYDAAAAIRSIMAAPLRAATLQRLAGYLK